MRKLIIIAASIVALAVPTAAMAVNSVDDAGFGHVAKGDVQSALGWNDAKLQRDFASVKFTNKAVTDYDYSWNCSDGSTHHSISTMTMIRQLDASTVQNTSAKKVTGWTLNGLNPSDPGVFTMERTGGVDIYSCPTGGSPNYNSLGMTPTSTNIVQANGLDLPVTPLAIPAA